MLIFADNVKKYFDGMFADYGIPCTSLNDYVVRYSNERVFVNITYDQGRSFEVNLFFGSNESPDNDVSFNIGELLRLKDVESDEGYRGLQVSTQISLDKAVERLADVFKKYGDEIINGDSEILSQLNMLREQECSQNAINQNLRYIRQDIERAWCNKDYRKVVELYGSIESVMLPLERKKLEYSRKQIND